MNRIVKYGLIIISIFTVGFLVVYGVFINTFNLFGEPEKTILGTSCDLEGLRQATIFEYSGNAVTNPSILVSIDLGCSTNPNDSKKKIVFSAERKNGATLEAKWKSFDTLDIIYSNSLELVTKIKQVSYPDSTLNLIIEYKEK